MISPSDKKRMVHFCDHCAKYSGKWQVWTQDYVCQDCGRITGYANEKVNN